MKFILLLFFIGLSIASKYDPQKAILYARKYCNSTRYRDNDYDYNQEGEDVSFVSKCLLIGGLSFTGCDGLNDKGLFNKVSDLRKCLQRRGWRFTGEQTYAFKAGYPLIIDNVHVGLATQVEMYNVSYCAHSEDRCDYPFDRKRPNRYLFYYPQNY